MIGKGEERIAQSDTVNHVWHSEPRVRAKLIKNTRGHSWEITAEAKTPEELVKILEDTEDRMKSIWGKPI